jgi:hypothetical protein
VRGRAVVARSGLWDMIDAHGNYMIPPIYEEVAWDAESEIDGVDFVIDRSGKRVD